MELPILAKPLSDKIDPVATMSDTELLPPEREVIQQLLSNHTASLKRGGNLICRMIPSLRCPTRSCHLQSVMSSRSSSNHTASLKSSGNLICCISN